MIRRFLSTPLCIMALFVAPVLGAEHSIVGLTANDTRIEALAVAGPSLSSPTVLLIGGLAGKDDGTEVVARLVSDFEGIPQTQRRFRLLAIPLANPEAHALQFPPTGVAYRENVESHVLWRWIAIQAPDLVVIAGPSDAGLAGAISGNPVGFVGKIPAQRMDSGADLLKSLPSDLPLSEAHREIDRRRSRSPRELAGELTKVYGNDFSQATYIPAMALIGRLRLGQTAEVARLLEPYLNGSQDSFARPSQGGMAGHMVFAEMAQRTGDKRAITLVRRIADTGFTADGTMREFMPLHGGWSDSVFMDIPILAKAGALTGERKYFDMAARHFWYMQNIVRRPDGLYRHQASTDAAWSRGNGFPALGLAMTLSDFPKDYPEYSRLVAEFQKHMKALAPLQQQDGMWREVLDYPGAYPEYSGTAMIAIAMLRGIRQGWLERETYQPLIDRAWQAILVRTSSDGRVFDIAESTGTRGLTFNDYVRRAAILGRDDRGGAFALLLATEMANLK
jgi:unsaturated rhamnogalacturonyl hydrolase